MATQVQRRKGTTVQHSTFTGASAELTVDTTKNTVVVHDGATAGGIPLAKESGSALSPSSLSLPNGTANAVPYLNGSKVLTTGSALTFDGSNFGVGTSSPTSYGASYSVLEIAGSTSGVINVKSGSTLYGQISNSTNEFKIDAVGASSSLVFLRNTTEGMRLTSTGLGIGTSSPAEKLQVVGKILSTGDGRIGVKKAGSDSVGSGPFFSLQNADASREWFNQLGASNSLDWWFYNGSSYTKYVTLDSSGNLGLGVTPSAWNASYYKVLQVSDRGAHYASNTITYSTAPSLFFGNNAFSDVASGAGFKYVTTNPSAQYRQVNAEHQWYNAPSGTAGNDISFTQAMTLDASGNLGVGTTSPVNRVHVVGSAASNVFRAQASSSGDGIVIRPNTAGNGGDLFSVNNAQDAYTPLNIYGSRIVFGANGSESARIDSSGNLIQSAPTTAPTLATNGTMVFNLTSNTNLRVSVRGSDGVTRTANLTLA